MDDRLVSLNLCEDIYCARCPHSFLVTLQKQKGVKLGWKYFTCVTYLFFVGLSYFNGSVDKKGKEREALSSSVIFLPLELICLPDFTLLQQLSDSVCLLCLIWEIWAPLLKRSRLGSAPFQVSPLHDFAPEHEDRTLVFKKVWHLSSFHRRSVSAFHDRCASVTSERADHDVSRLAALLSIRSHRVGHRRPAVVLEASLAVSIHYSRGARPRLLSVRSVFSAIR